MAFERLEILSVRMANYGDFNGMLSSWKLAVFSKIGETLMEANAQVLKR